MPDMVTCAKSIANGFPMAALITTPEIAEKMKEAITFNTFGGNPMACAAASATLEVITGFGKEEIVGTDRRNK